MMCYQLATCKTQTEPQLGQVLPDVDPPRRDIWLNQVAWVLNGNGLQFCFQGAKMVILHWLPVDIVWSLLVGHLCAFRGAVAPYFPPSAPLSVLQWSSFLWFSFLAGELCPSEDLCFSWRLLTFFVCPRNDAFWVGSRAEEGVLSLWLPEAVLSAGWEPLVHGSVASDFWASGILREAGQQWGNKS